MSQTFFLGGMIQNFIYFFILFSRTNVQGRSLGAEAVGVLPLNQSLEAEAVDDRPNQAQLPRVRVLDLLPERQPRLQQNLLASQPLKLPSQSKRRRLQSRRAEEGLAHVCKLRKRKLQQGKQRLSHRRAPQPEEGFLRERQRL